MVVDDGAISDVFTRIEQFLLHLAVIIFLGDKGGVLPQRNVVAFAHRVIKQISKERFWNTDRVTRRDDKVFVRSR